MVSDFAHEVAHEGDGMVLYKYLKFENNDESLNLKIQL